MNFNITLLTRNREKTTQEFPGLKAVQVDYDSSERIVKTLHKEVGSQDALVILINRDQLQPQINLMEAAIATGIPHVVPSCFGIGSRDASFRSLPIWETKVQMEDYVIRKADEGAFTFTGIQTGAFFDYALDRGIFVNLKGGDVPTVFFDGGDVPFSVTVMDDIGRAVVTALVKANQLRNKFAFVHSAVVTQNQLLAYAKEAAPDRNFRVLHLDTADMEKQAWEKYNAGDRSPEAMRGFMPRATFGKRMGEFRKTDNALFGIEQWSDEKLKQFVTSYFK